MLWQYIKEQMMRHPGQKICEDGAFITYEEAVIYAESFAEELTAPCCALLCHSEMATALALLSCLAAGVTAVPMSYRYGDRPLRKMMDKIQPPCIISDTYGKLQAVQTGLTGYVPPKEHPALIMCTSGTTGSPKGVMLSERNLLCNLKDIAAYFKVSDADRILIARPLQHCAVLNGEFLLALIRGLNIRFDSGQLSPLHLLNLIGKEQITVFGGTPTLLGLLASFIRSPERTACVKSIVVSGECLTKAVAGRIRKAFPQAAVYHVYGLSEASPRVAWLPPELFDTRMDCIGRPLQSVQIKIDGVCNADGQREGELLVRGDNVMLGYYNDPELTRKVLRDGWLRTGDIVREDRQGGMRILCRKDDMMIRGGVNIYPAEIENALKEDARTEDALAYSYTDHHGRTQIGIKIKGAFADEQSVRQLCCHVLPLYECPSRIELVDRLPRNASGKLIRRPQ